MSELIWKPLEHWKKKHFVISLDNTCVVKTVSKSLDISPTEVSIM